MILSSCGAAYSARGAYDHAASLIEEARAIWQERRDIWGLGLATHDLAMISAAQGRIEQAAALYLDSIGYHREIGDTAARGDAVAGLASLRAAQGDLSEAARLFGAAEALLEAGEIPDTATILDDHRAVIDTIRAALGEEAFAAAWAAGRGLTNEEVATEAQAVARAHSRPPD
jgi:tetratricopeptide (TPR) repeat protein